MKCTFLLQLCSFLFWTNIARAEDNVCSRPELGDNMQSEGLQLFFSPGAEVVLSCKPGYTPLFGPRTIVCKSTGTWTVTKLRCKPKLCPPPDPPVNGQMYYNSTFYLSTVNYACDDGYILIGASSALCDSNGNWSATEPRCKPISCGPAPIPEFGMIIYDRIIRDNKNINYGTSGTYRCLPPLALIGERRAECTASGQWTETPQCREVSCPPPENIEHGYMSVIPNKEYAYTDTVKYGCKGDYVLHGPLQIVCEKTGEWSDKPSCKAPCSVGIKRGRIMYKGNKQWIEDFKPNQILHGESVSVYCMDEGRNCGYAIPSQCSDGNLQIPECFEEPSATLYALKSGSLPSEIQQC